MKKYFFITLLVVKSCFLFAQIPAGYYDSAEGKKGRELKTALYKIIKDHTVISYNDLWEAFKKTDRNPGNNEVWDIYSNCSFRFDDDQCGNYSNECDCYNREHSMPKSWFDDKSPMNSDLFHIYPTDGYVNNRRDNYPYGEVDNASYTSGNGGKLGNNTFETYTGKVFEPVDEYKGDLARSFFYMVTCYEDIVDTWQYTDEAKAALNGTKYPAFTQWTLDLLLKWDNDDPVSQKEIDRNDSIYKLQHNRNPFIDHPEYVCMVWVDTCSASIGSVLHHSHTVSCFYKHRSLQYNITGTHKNIQVTVYNLLGKQLDTHTLKSPYGNFALPYSNSFFIVEFKFNNGDVIRQKIIAVND